MLLLRTILNNRRKVWNFRNLRNFLTSTSTRWVVRRFVACTSAWVSISIRSDRFGSGIISTHTSGIGSIGKTWIISVFTPRRGFVSTVRGGRGSAIGCGMWSTRGISGGLTADFGLPSGDDGSGVRKHGSYPISQSGR
jgi:hypothetical protein